MTKPRPRFQFTLRRLVLITVLFAPVFAGVVWCRERILQQRALVVREEVEALRRALEATAMRGNSSATDVVPERGS